MICSKWDKNTWYGPLVLWYFSTEVKAELTMLRSWHLSPLFLQQVTLSAQVSSSVRREWWRTPAPWAWRWSSGSSRVSSPPSGRCATLSWVSPSPSRGETIPTSRTSSEGWPGEQTDTFSHVLVVLLWAETIFQVYLRAIFVWFESVSAIYQSSWYIPKESSFLRRRKLY